MLLALVLRKGDDKRRDDRGIDTCTVFNPPPSCTLFSAAASLCSCCWSRSAFTFTFMHLHLHSSPTLSRLSPTTSLSISLSRVRARSRPPPWALVPTLEPALHLDMHQDASRDALSAICSFVLLRCTRHVFLALYDFLSSVRAAWGRRGGGGGCFQIFSLFLVQQATSGIHHRVK